MTIRKIKTSGPLGTLSATIVVEGILSEETMTSAANAGAESAYMAFGNLAKELSSLAEETDPRYACTTSSTMKIDEGLVKIRASVSFASDPSLVSVGLNEAVSMIGRSVVLAINPLDQERLMRRMAAANPMMAQQLSAMPMQQPPMMQAQQTPAQQADTSPGDNLVNLGLYL